MYDDHTPAITIDPPLTLEEMRSFPGGFRTVFCYPAADGGAGSLLPREGTSYRPQWITEHLQAIIDYFPDHKFSGYVEYRSTSSAQPLASRYWVCGRVVKPEHARMVWPVDDEVAANDGAMIKAFAVLYAREHGGYIARDGDLNDDGAGFDILWVTLPTPDGPRDIGLHLDDSAGLDDIPSRRGERREVPDEDRMLEILTAARPAVASEAKQRVPARMSADAVAAMLSELALRVKAGDSFDGNITYRSEPFSEVFDVTAVCGVGYLDGQPNVRTIEGGLDS